MCHNGFYKLFQVNVAVLAKTNFNYEEDKFHAWFITSKDFKFIRRVLTKRFVLQGRKRSFMLFYQLRS